MKRDLTPVISSLMVSIARSARLLAQFISVLSLGVLAAILLLLPWILRLLALLSWLAGTYWSWTTIQIVYGSFTPTLPLIALASIPVILSVALVMWWLMKGEPGKTFGAMSLWGALGWMIHWGASRLQAWTYGSLVIQILPAALSVSLLIFITARWGRVIRMRRSFLRSQQPGGDTLTDLQQKEGAPTEIPTSP